MSEATAKKSTVLPTSVEEVPEQGKGGLRKSILTATLLPSFFIAIILTIAGFFVYSGAIQGESKEKLENIADAVLIYYDHLDSGDYNLVIDEKNQTTHLLKGDTLISADLGYLDLMAESTGTEITIFFYDTRMMTTISDGRGERIRNTIANSNIVEKVLESKEPYFFNDVEITGVRYCAVYVPIFGSDGTCIGMIGIAENYREVLDQAYKFMYINGVIMLIAFGMLGIFVVRYMDNQVHALTHIREFLKKISEGELDAQLNMEVIQRGDEIGDMGRLINYLRASLKKLVERDTLTNLNNRRSGMQRLNQIRAKAERNGTSYSVAMGDIDFFKNVNDTYGHDAGDAVLKAVARIISKAMRNSGAAIRWGGEEFLFVFDGEDERTAAKRLQDILDEIRQAVVVYDEKEIRFTMSYGVIEGDINRTAEKDINLADERLYFAKKSGRNRVISGEEFISQID